jgi:hypothetical protein
MIFVILMLLGFLTLWEKKHREPKASMVVTMSP